jgi:hypothetical protein
MAGPCEVVLIAPDSDPNNKSVVQETFPYPETLNQMLLGDYLEFLKKMEGLANRANPDIWFVVLPGVFEKSTHLFR